jgi:cathepsin L
MRVLLVLAALVAAALAVNNPMSLPTAEEEIQYAFRGFVSRFGRNYTTSYEQDLRYGIFRANYNYVKAHNSGPSSFKLAVNKFADLTNAEFRALYNGYVRSISNPRRGELFVPTKQALPTTVDWRTKNVVTNVKNQGSCGSCWSFSATGSMEGQHALKTGTLVSLSEQNLMDCSTAEGNQGCNGGLMDQAFEYVIKNKGIDTEASYPYTAEDGTCHFKSANIGATISSYKDIAEGSESDLQNAVATVGPVSVAIDASNMSFQLYSSGVYDEPNCSSTELDHGVLAVGYGTSGSTAYWLVKNSWGEDWGSNGYIMMSRNKDNQCGIATDASYPVV